MKKIGWIQIVFTVMRVNIGLAGLILDHDARSYELIARVFDGKKEGLTRNEKLDNITLNGIEVVAVHIHKDLKVFFFAFWECRGPCQRIADSIE